MNEIWKDVPDFEGSYEVSNQGRVRSITRLVKGKNGKDRHKEGQVLRPQTGSSYAQVYLPVDGKQKWFYVHRLVAEAFIPNPDNLPMVNHKDENPLNNNVENLEWCDSKYNINYGNAIERRTTTQRRNFEKKLEELGLTREEYERKRYEEYYAKNREKIIAKSLERYYKNKKRTIY